MQKIPSLFKRDYDGTRLVYDEVVPGCEWVLAGEGVATLKLDGTCCLIEDGVLYKRHELKAGKPAPKGFRPAQDADAVTGDIPGWVPVDRDDPSSRWHVEAFTFDIGLGYFPDGTYELVGPKVQGNIYGYGSHILLKHGSPLDDDPPRTFAGLKEYLGSHHIEGIVWHHPDGRMCKIKRRDFGYKWPEKDGK